MLAALLTGCVVTTPVSAERYLQTVAVDNFDLTAVPDGTYTGRYALGAPAAQAAQTAGPTVGLFLGFRL